MKKLNVLFAAALALALGAGLFVSCDAGGDNTEELLANIRAMEQERINSILGVDLDILQTASEICGHVAETGVRKFGEDGEKHVVLTFTAYPDDDYRFNLTGVSAEYDGTAVTPVAHPTKPNVFTVTVPAGTKKVFVHVVDGAFENTSC